MIRCSTRLQGPVKAVTTLRSGVVNSVSAVAAQVRLRTSRSLSTNDLTWLSSTVALPALQVQQLVSQRRQDSTTADMTDSQDSHSSPGLDSQTAGNDAAWVRRCLGRHAHDQSLPPTTLTVIIDHEDM